MNKTSKHVIININRTAPTSDSSIQEQTLHSSCAMCTRSFWLRTRISGCVSCFLIFCQLIINKGKGEKENEDYSKQVPRGKELAEVAEV